MKVRMKREREEAEEEEGVLEGAVEGVLEDLEVGEGVLLGLAESLTAEGDGGGRVEEGSELEEEVAAVLVEDGDLKERKNVASEEWAKKSVG